MTPGKADLYDFVGFVWRPSDLHREACEKNHESFIDTDILVEHSHACSPFARGMYTHPTGV